MKPLPAPQLKRCEPFLAAAAEIAGGGGDFSNPQAKSPLGNSAGAGPGSFSEPDFVALFLADQRRLYHYIVALLGTEQDAEDVLQETAAVMWRKFSSFRQGTSFFSWACKTAYLSVLEYRRRKGRAVPLLDPDVLELVAALSQKDSSQPAQRVAALEQCLMKLAPKDRLLIDACYVHRTKARQIATALGRPEASVYRSLGRIRRALVDCVRRSISAAERQGGGI